MPVYNPKNLKYNGKDENDSTIDRFLEDIRR